MALYPAKSESEKISFNQLNRQTGHRIKYMKVDADTGEEVANKDIVKGQKVETDTFIEVTKEELEKAALESARTIEIGLIRRPRRHRSPLSDPVVDELERLVLLHDPDVDQLVGAPARGLSVALRADYHVFRRADVAHHAGAQLTSVCSIALPTGDAGWV